jgi:hypothetical protein
MIWVVHPGVKNSPYLGSESATLMTTKGHERGFLSHTVYSHSTGSGEQLVYFPGWKALGREDGMFIKLMKT